jgi:hypothetical protein
VNKVSADKSQAIGRTERKRETERVRGKRMKLNFVIKIPH